MEDFCFKWLSPLNSIENLERGEDVVVSKFKVQGTVEWDLDKAGPLGLAESKLSLS